MTSYLEVLFGSGVGRRYPLGLGEATLGREAACEIPCFDEQASRRHAAIASRGDAFYLRDLQSRNGTFLNGAPISGEALLRHGDEVQLGDTRLRFISEDASARETAPGGQTGGSASFSVERAVGLRDGPEPEAGTDAERKLRALLALGRLIARTDAPDTLLREAARVLPRTLDADRVVAIPLGDDGALAALRAVSFPEGPLPSAALLGRALGGSEALLISAGDRLLARESVVQQGVRSVLVAPMLAGDRPYGVLYADRLRSGRQFSEADLEFWRDVARQLGAASAALTRTRDAREVGEAWRRAAARGRPRRGAPIVGESPVFLRALALARRAAKSEASVLLAGETGTGKEVFARLIHAEGLGVDAPFVAINCAALPEALLESELFGHERGAFTGADRRRRGLFELADRGTLLLDEVGEMPAGLQSKLLRVLESGELRRLGAERTQRVRVRILAATNRDLRAEVRAGRFREDLYYRLCVLSLELPPLRARPGDAILLADAFLQEIAARSGRPVLEVGAQARRALERYPWPGNVRELRNALQRAVALAEGPEIDAALLPAAVFSAEVLVAGGGVAATAEADPISLAEAEQRAIVAALAHTGGRKGRAAKLLGIAHPTLNRKLKAYGLEPT